MRSRQDTLRLVEECVGVGEVTVRERVFPRVRYEVRRFQAMTPSGMPVPGLHRIEGRIGMDALAEPPAPAPSDCVLRLTLVDPEGRVLAEGHGPSRCHCC